MEFKTIKPSELGTIALAFKKTPDVVIEFMPVVKRNVGIGWLTEGEANAQDFKKYPVVLRPWINVKKFSKL